MISAGFQHLINLSMVGHHFLNIILSPFLVTCITSTFQFNTKHLNPYHIFATIIQLHYFVTVSTIIRLKPCTFYFSSFHVIKILPCKHTIVSFLFTIGYIPTLSFTMYSLHPCIPNFMLIIYAYILDQQYPIRRVVQEPSPIFHRFLDSNAPASFSTIP